MFNLQNHRGMRRMLRNLKDEQELLQQFPNSSLIVSSPWHRSDSNQDTDTLQFFFNFPFPRGQI